MESLERNIAPAGFALNFDDGVERHERHAEIGWMGRDTIFAPSEDGMKPVVAAVGIAACAGRAFIAGTGDVIKVGAAGALQEITANRGGVA